MVDSQLPPPTQQQYGGYTVQTNTDAAGNKSYTLVNPGLVGQALKDYISGAVTAGAEQIFALAQGAGWIPTGVTLTSGGLNYLNRLGVDAYSTPLAQAGLAAQQSLAAFTGSSTAAGYTNQTQAINQKPMGLYDSSGTNVGIGSPTYYGTNSPQARNLSNLLASPSNPIATDTGRVYGPVQAPAAPGLGTTYAPYGNYRQTELQNTSTYVNPLSGEIAYYQQSSHTLPALQNIYAYNPQTRQTELKVAKGEMTNLQLIGGGGAGAAQSGQFAQTALTPLVLEQSSGKYVTPQYSSLTANAPSALELLTALTKGTAKDLYSSIGSEAYGGTVQRFDNRTLQGLGINYSDYKYPAAQGNLSDLTVRSAVNINKAYTASNIPWSTVGGGELNIMMPGNIGSFDTGYMRGTAYASPNTDLGLGSAYTPTPKEEKKSIITPPPSYGLLETPTKGNSFAEFAAVSPVAQTIALETPTQTIGGLTFRPAGVATTLPVPTLAQVNAIELNTPLPTSQQLGSAGVDYLKASSTAYSAIQSSPQYSLIGKLGAGAVGAFATIPGQVATAQYAVSRSIENPSEFLPAFTSSAAAIPGQIVTEITTNPIGFVGGLVAMYGVGKLGGGIGTPTTIGDISTGIKSAGGSFKAGVVDITQGIERGGVRAFGNEYGMIAPPKTIDLTNVPLPQQPKGLPTLDLTNAPAPEFGIYRSPKQAAQLSIDINRAAEVKVPTTTEGLPTFDLTNAPAPEFGIYRSPKQAAQLSIDINRAAEVKVPTTMEGLPTFDLTNAPAPEFGSYRTPQQILGNVIRAPPDKITGSPIQSPSSVYGSVQVVKQITKTTEAKQIPTLDLTNVEVSQLPKANLPKSIPQETTRGGGQILLTQQQEAIPVIDLRETIDLTNVEVPKYATARAYEPTTIPTIDLTNVEPTYIESVIPTSKTEVTPVFDLSKATASLEDRVVSTKTNVETVAISDVISPSIISASTTLPVSKTISSTTLLPETIVSTGVVNSPFAPVTEAVTPKPIVPIPIPAFGLPNFGSSFETPWKKRRFGRFNEKLMGIKFDVDKTFGIKMKGFAGPKPKKGKPKRLSSSKTKSK
jgi:hypothetical protein